MNPFDLPRSAVSSQANAVAPEDDPLSEKLESLLVLFGLLLSPESGLSPAERGALHASLGETYARRGITGDPATHGREAPVLADLLAVLGEDDDPHHFAGRLARFASGRVGGVFVGRTNVDLSRRLVVFDVRDLGEELLPVGTQLIADFVWGRARGRSRPLRLVVDEAWSLVRSTAGGRFLGGLARRARKHFIGLTTITQDVGDFLGSEEGRAILQNSAVTLLLRQDVSAIDRVVQTLKLSEGERDFLLRAAKGQGLFCADGNRVAVEIVASSAEHRLVTSDPREVTAIGREDAEAASTADATGQGTEPGSRLAVGVRR